jgi:hypothetical protein
MWNFVLFLIALLIWAVSLFLVGEAAKSQKWALGRSDGMADPHSGVAMSQLLSLLFLILWLARVFFSTAPAVNPFHFISQVLVRPDQFTPGLLLASFPPLIVGMVKLVTALVVSRGEAEIELQQQNRRRVTWVFLLLHLTMAGVAAILLQRSLSHY